jgi:hypothetical protein
MYIIFCLTTAIIALVTLYNQVLLKCSVNNIIQHKNLSRLVFFILAVIAAPALFLAVIIPSVGERFISAMSEEINKD